MTIIITCSLLAPPVPDLGGTVFGDFQPRLGRRHDRSTAGLAELERRVGVAGHEHPFNAHGYRLVQPDDLADTAKDNLQTFMQLATARADTTRRHILATTGRLANHAVTGDPRAGVDTKNQSHNACRI